MVSVYGLSLFPAHQAVAGVGIEMMEEELCRNNGVGELIDAS